MWVNSRVDALKQWRDLAKPLLHDSRRRLSQRLDEALRQVPRLVSSGDILLARGDLPSQGFGLALQFVGCR
jgi:hypothetical protein